MSLGVKSTVHRANASFSGVYAIAIVKWRVVEVEGEARRNGWR